MGEQGNELPCCPSTKKLRPAFPLLTRGPFSPAVCLVFHVLLKSKHLLWFFSFLLLKIIENVLKGE